jgi:hypothetical protein
MSTTKQDNKNRKSDNNDVSNSEEQGKSKKLVIRANAKEKFHKLFLSQATLVIVGVGKESESKCPFDQGSTIKICYKEDFPEPGQKRRQKRRRKRLPKTRTQILETSSLNTFVTTTRMDWTLT